jgi:hypothetical protein
VTRQRTIAGTALIATVLGICVQILGGADHAHCPWWTDHRAGRGRDLRVLSALAAAVAGAVAERRRGARAVRR